MNYFSHPISQAKSFHFFCVQLICIALCCSCSDVTQIYVSKKGDDANKGTKEAPYATPLAAKDAIAKIKKEGHQGPIELIIEEGTYYLDKPLLFLAAESGTEEAPYTIKAAAGQKVILSASTQLKLSWQKHTSHIWKASLPKGMGFESLFANGKGLIRARYPNYEANILPFNGYAANAISPEKVQQWKNPVGAYVHALHVGRWGGFHYKVIGKNAANELQMVGGQQNNRPSAMHETYRYVENVFEELDSPKEWYLDSAQHTLYYYPSSEEDIKQMKFEAAQLENLITLQGDERHPVHDIIIQGISFVHTAPTFMKTAEPLLRSDWTIYRQGAVKIEGAERCKVLQSDFYKLGGNAIFVSNYNRQIEIKGNLIENIGAGGINLVGNPSAVRSPAFRYEEFVPTAEMDTISGPKTNQYPALCDVSDNLIRNIGHIEKQVAGVQISMASEIRVTHNTIYNVPRAGINIGDGTWGGHLLAHNDVFNTVLETSDHGAFNSWGRDRFWHPNRATMDSITAKHPAWVKLDAIKTTIIRNNRFQCAHGWDIDLDDGSTNYNISNNLCLGGGLKLREGFYRRVHNNVMVNNGFHPHVWFQNSHDVFKNNLVMQVHQDIQVKYWGDTIDYNLYTSTQALKKDKAKGIEQHSIAIETRFVNASIGDFNIANADSTPFKPFDMQHFGVVSERLKQLAENPKIPILTAQNSNNKGETCEWQKSIFKNIETLGEQSAAGLPTVSGILALTIPANSPLLKTALRPGDVIVNCNGQQVNNVDELLKILKGDQYKSQLNLTVYRNQKQQRLIIKQ